MPPKRKSKRKTKHKSKRSIRGYKAEGRALGLAFVKQVKKYSEYRAKGVSISKAKKKAGL